MELFGRLVDDLGGSKAAPSRLGCSPATVKRLQRGEHAVRDEMMSTMMANVDAPPPWDRESLENIVVTYCLEGAPPEVQRIWAQAHAGVDTSLQIELRAELDNARKQIEALDAQLQLAQHSLLHRDESLIERHRTALLRAQADAAGKIELAKGVARALAVMIEAHCALCRDPWGLPGLDALHGLLRGLGVEPVPFPPQSGDAAGDTARDARKHDRPQPPLVDKG